MAGLAVLVAALAGCDPTPVMLRGLVTASQTASPGAGPAPTSIDYPNTGLALIPVEVWSDVSETLVYSTQTDSFGRYEVHESTVPAGTYRVRIGARWWNGASDWATATPVALTNTSITEINTQVSTDISLEGRMLDDAWAPSPGTWVQALDTVGNTVASTITDPATGRFDLSIPTAGIYTLKTLTPPATVAVAVGGTTPTAFAVASGNTVTAGSIDYETGMSMAATPTQVDAGFAHTCALMSDGTIYCWGSNNGGQLGNGTATDTNTPVPVAGITNATSITAGGYHTCATLTDESVVCWGYNGDGQLGNGANINALTPAPVTGIANATSITAGYLHTCATRSDDTIACWGQNTYGQLGNGGNTSTNTPVPVTGITNATSVTAGTDHTCATRSDNTIACWGYTNANSNPGPSPHPSVRWMVPHLRHPQRQHHRLLGVQRLRTTRQRNQRRLHHSGTRHRDQQRHPRHRRVLPHLRHPQRQHHRMLGPKQLRAARQRGKHQLQYPCPSGRDQQRLHQHLQRPRAHLRHPHRRHHRLLGRQRVRPARGRNRHRLERPGRGVAALSRHR
ncbi:MAG: hypothetical protein IPG97_07485 [Microthrixaceae bacterium]|nr:hypothetical protein [Microthrixaceae bacterium]